MIEEEKNSNINDCFKSLQAPMERINEAILEMGEAFLGMSALLEEYAIVIEREKQLQSIMTGIPGMIA